MRSKIVNINEKALRMIINELENKKQSRLRRQSKRYKTFQNFNVGVYL